MFFIKFRMFSIISSSNLSAFFSLLSFWDSYYVYVDMPDGVSQILDYVHDSSFFFSSSDWIISISLSSSSLFLAASSDLLLSSPSEFVISVIVLFESEVSIFPPNFYLYWYYLMRQHSCTPSFSRHNLDI